MTGLRDWLIYFSGSKDDPQEDDKKTETEKEETDADADVDVASSDQSGDTVPVILGSKGSIQWKLGTPMPDPRARACAVAVDYDTIFVIGTGGLIDILLKAYYN